MDEDKAKLLAHELSIAYIRADAKLLKPKESIQDIVDDFADINRRFYDAVMNNDMLKKLY